MAIKFKIDRRYRTSLEPLATGIFKANFPTRLTFQVSSKTDSHTIIDTNGAESLLGNGDMLFLPSGTTRFQRIHGAYISEAELTRIVEFLKKEETVVPMVSRSDVVACGWATPLSLVLIDGGHAPREVFKLVLASARFIALPRIKLLGVLKRKN